MHTKLDDLYLSFLQLRFTILKQKPVFLIFERSKNKNLLTAGFIFVLARVKVFIVFLINCKKFLEKFIQINYHKIGGLKDDSI